MGKLSSEGPLDPVVAGLKIVGEPVEPSKTRAGSTFGWRFPPLFASLSDPFSDSFMNHGADEALGPEIKLR